MAEAFLVQRIAGGGKDIGQADVTLDFTSVTYDGSEHQPAVQSVTYNGAELVELRDYVVYSAAYTDAGTYNIVISGIGDYSGAKEVPWTIEKAANNAYITISGEKSLLVNQSYSFQIVYPKLSWPNIEVSKIDVNNVIEVKHLNTTEKTSIYQITALKAGSVEVTVRVYDKNHEPKTFKFTVIVSAYYPVFENNTWAQIAQACKEGKAKDLWSVGDTKAFTIGDETYHMQIIGFDHDDLHTTDAYYNDSNYNGGNNKAAITLQMVELYKVPYKPVDNARDIAYWVTNNIRVKALPEIKPLIDQELIANIRIVTKLAMHYLYYSTPDKYADDLFILSESEIANSTKYSGHMEGNQYRYYSIGGSKIKIDPTFLVASQWATRSYDSTSALYIVTIDSNGVVSHGVSENNIVFPICCCI